jgi:hypothetical protein
MVSRNDGAEPPGPIWRNGKKLKPGDEITVTGHPAKNGLKVMNLRKISYANGEVIPLGPPPEPGQ